MDKERFEMHVTQALVERGAIRPQMSMNKSGPSSTAHRQTIACIRGKGGTVYLPKTSNIQSRFVGHNVTIHSHVWIGDKVIIGNNCKIQAFSFLPNGVKIGNNVFIGPRVTFTNDKHPPSPNWSDTIIEDDVSIGAGVVILPGITIGKGATIGAGSVVTKNVPSGETWFGNPAKKYK